MSTHEGVKNPFTKTTACTFALSLIFAIAGISLTLVGALGNGGNEVMQTIGTIFVFVSFLGLVVTALLVESTFQNIQPTLVE